MISSGAVGIEMAAELKDVFPSLSVTLIHSRAALLSSEPLPEDFKQQTLILLRQQKINVILGQRVTKITSHGSTSILTLSDGTQMTAGHVIRALSRPVPTTTYLPSSALNAENYVRISPSLHFPQEVPNHYRHFAAGDIAAWSGIKRCGGAMHMGYYVAENIYMQILQHYTQAPVDSVSQSSDPITPASDAASSESSLSMDSDLEMKVPFKRLQEFPPVIGLALGKTAIGYSPTEGMKWGAEVLQRMFGDDLGLGICWNYMQLGKTPEIGKAS
jgi:NADH dehydrogenase FAD-containing subunit